MNNTLLTLLVAASLLGGFGVLAWQLWRAWTEGKILGRMGRDIDRHENPGFFWITVSLYTLMVSMSVVFAISVTILEIIKAFR